MSYLIVYETPLYSEMRYLTLSACLYIISWLYSQEVSLYVVKCLCALESPSPVHA